MVRALLPAVLLALCALGVPGAAASHALVRDCSAAEVGSTVRGFVRAFDVGNRGHLDAAFARDDGDGDAATPSFQWYSIGPPGARLGRAASNRATLVPYLLARHRRGERLRLVTLHLGANAHGYFNFTFHVRRAARDLRRPGVFEGKGAAICKARGAQIAVWSVGGRVPAG
jgi:hypothetical protein